MKKIEFKPIVTTILLILFQTLCYFISKFFQADPYLIGNLIDDKIPFSVWAIIPYFTWYLLIFLVPYFLFIKNKESFIKYVYAYIFTTVVANIIFIIFPTTVARPEVTVSGPITFVTKFIFDIDTPIMNCFPSLHCAMSMLFILYMFENKDINKWIKISTLIVSIIIMISTLFIKQHVFVDLVSGDILASIIYLFVRIIYKENNILKKALKI